MPIRRRSPAFSLLELLIVVGIIGVLAAISVPAMSRARHQARQTVCSAQLREVFNGLFLYAHDHSGGLPYMGSYYRVTRYAHPEVDRGWPSLIAPYLGTTWDVYGCPSDQHPATARVVGTQVTRVDDAEAGTLRAASAPNEQIVAFSYRGEERRQGRLTDPKRPSDAVLLLEGRTHPTDVADHFHEIVRPQPESRRPGAQVVDPVHPSFRRHLGRSHFLFFNGAIEAISAPALEGVQRRHRDSGLAWAAPPPQG